MSLNYRLGRNSTSLVSCPLIIIIEEISDHNEDLQWMIFKCTFVDSFLKLCLTLEKSEVFNLELWKDS